MTDVDRVRLRDLIRDVPDFPKPGILYRDITTLLKDVVALRTAVRAMAEPFRNDRIDAVAGVEARGFILGAPVALELGCGFLPVRKAGKLPADTIAEEYELEYGTASVEIHRDAASSGDRILLIDDVLATGGTMEATCRLCERLGVEIAGLSFLVELIPLEGRSRLNGYRIECLLKYD